jgi:hypothetical protein
VPWVTICAYGANGILRRIYEAPSANPTGFKCILDAECIGIVQGENGYVIPNGQDTGECVFDLCQGGRPW